MTAKAATFNRLKQEFHTDPALEAMPVIQGMQRHWLSGTWGIDLAINCWCSKSHRLDTLGWRRMVEGFNRFCREHSYCEPSEVKL